MEEFNEKLNLDDLFNTQKNVEDNKIKIYQKILQRVHKKIKTISRSRNCEKHCFYHVPEFVLGVPIYDTSTCITYIIDKLLDNGFHVRYIHPNMLFISWQHYIPYHTRMELKKKKGIKIDGFGNVIHKNKFKNNEDEDINTLMFKKKDELSIKKKNKDTNFKEISTYKPTGNFIYSDSLINKLSESVK
jgi:hypothetical protein